MARVIYARVYASDDRNPISVRLTRIMRSMLAECAVTNITHLTRGGDYEFGDTDCRRDKWIEITDDKLACMTLASKCVCIPIRLY